MLSGMLQAEQIVYIWTT